MTCDVINTWVQTSTLLINSNGFLESYKLLQPNVLLIITLDSGYYYFPHLSDEENEKSKILCTRHRVIGQN